MPSADTFALVDLLFEGGLADRLQTWRAEGLTLAEIAFRLRTEHGVNVSVSTIFRWVRDRVEAA